MIHSAVQCRLSLIVFLIVTSCDGFIPPIVKSTLAINSAINSATLSWETCTNDIGRVEDVDEWIEWSSDSLERHHGKSLYEVMGVTSAREVHENTRFAVLSHGTQEDPIFCYSNVAARAVFQYSEAELYQIPSRYSAPSVPDVQDSRERMKKEAVKNNWVKIPDGIRQRKDKSLFAFKDVLYWNVFDEKGEVVGQSAVFDRDMIVDLE